jgi:hypothetical protein
MVPAAPPHLRARRGEDERVHGLREVRWARLLTGDELQPGEQQLQHDLQHLGRLKLALLTQHRLNADPRLVHGARL